MQTVRFVYQFWYVVPDPPAGDPNAHLYQYYYSTHLKRTSMAMKMLVNGGYLFTL